MVKVNYASLQTQSSTMSSVSQSRVAGFNQLLSAFNSFGDSGNELIGTGYDAARVYATSVMSPYYKGFILYSEAVSDAANTLADNYVAKCGSENLDEEQLQAEIDSITRGCMSLSASISGLQSKTKPAEGDAARISRLQEQLTAAQSQLTTVQEKLANLKAFSAESLLACTSADTYQLLIYQAMSGISTSFGGGSFALPQDLSWVGDVEQGWADREIAMENNYLSALEKVKNGETLTETELTAIERYAAAYPDRVDDSVIQYVQQARQVKAEEMKYRSIIDKVDAGKSLTDEETKFFEEYKKNHPDVGINPEIEKLITIQKNPDEIFKKNLQEQYGFDKETATTMWKLYHNIKKREGESADYIFNRIIGGMVYDNDNSLSGPIKNIMWNFTAGGHQIDTDITRKYKIRYKELQTLKEKILEQHNNKKGYNDFAHQSITTATILQPQIFPDVNNAMWAINSNLGKTNSTDPIQFTAELAGWRGDVTGQALASPNMGNDDYKADLDAVNISSLMWQKELDYAMASNLYYHELENGNYTRAEQFVKNVGGKKYLYSEIFKSENVKNMNELSAKNPTAYNFLKSLNGDIENDKGGNSNEYTDFKE